MVKSMEENIGETLQDINTGKDILGKNPGRKVISVQISKEDCIQGRTGCMTKKAFMKVKKKLSE